MTDSKPSLLPSRLRRTDQRRKRRERSNPDGFEAPCRLLGPGLARGRSGVKFDVSGSS